MKIIWTKPAKKDLRRIFNYYQKKVSKSIANKIINSVFDRIDILQTQNIGVKEVLLENLNQKHQYLIDGNFKII